MRRNKASWPVHREEELRRLWDKGYSNSAIARELGISRNAVIGKGKRLGLPPHEVLVRGKCSRADVGVKSKSTSREEPVEVPVPVKKKRTKPTGERRTREEWNSILAEAVRNTKDRV